ncbi:hypothetical protein LY76DRAFT_202119 [Colletotrichum caudatum]|nr:hypothetical protein LY76DRAFT_202119 [Colletotrichum caudatum]
MSGLACAGVQGTVLPQRVAHSWAEANRSRGEAGRGRDVLSSPYTSWAGSNPPAYHRVLESPASIIRCTPYSSPIPHVFDCVAAHHERISAGHPQDQAQHDGVKERMSTMIRQTQPQIVVRQVSPGMRAVVFGVGGREKGGGGKRAYLDRHTGKRPTSEVLSCSRDQWKASCGLRIARIPFSRGG